MRSISDDDFDKLFRDKLYSCRVEPTEAVWDNISRQLVTQKKKKEFPFLLVAAASLAAVISVGIWLAETKQPMRLTAVETPQETETVKSQPSLPNSAQLIQNEPVQAAASESYKAVANDKRTVLKAEKRIYKADPVIVQKEISADLKVEQGEPKLASRQVEEAVYPGATDPGLSSSPTSYAMVSDADLSLTEDAESKPQRQKQIRSVGSLVNFVVSKVDKRRNKIIEFQDGEEGSMVSGMNLGLLKFRSKE